MSLTTRILSALAAGLVLGALLAQWAPGGPLTTADVIGALWLNALRMTIVPLVFAMLVTGAATAVATAEAGGIAVAFEMTSSPTVHSRPLAISRKKDRSL